MCFRSDLHIKGEQVRPAVADGPGNGSCCKQQELCCRLLSSSLSSFCSLDPMFVSNQCPLHCSGIALAWPSILLSLAALEVSPRFMKAFVRPRHNAQIKIAQGQQLCCVQSAVIQLHPQGALLPM